MPFCGKMRSSCDPGWGIGWVSSWLAIYQTLSISSIIASALLRVARVCAILYTVYCILYTVYCILYAIAMHPFFFMGPLRVSASYLLMPLPFLAYYVSFVLFYFLSSYRFRLVFVVYALSRVIAFFLYLICSRWASMC